MVRLLAVTFIAVLAANAAAATAAAVHEKFKITGTVLKVHADQIDVKAVDGQTYEMDFFPSVPVFRDGRKVNRRELGPGVSVIVNALGHDMFDLEAVDVHIVPAATLGIRK